MLTSGPSLLQKSDMCKRNQKLKEHSLSLKNSLVVNECDHSERGSLFWPIAWILKKKNWSSTEWILVEFSTTSVLLFEGMLCSCKVLHSVPTNSSRCLVNQGAVLPFSASRSSKQAPVSILLQAIPCLIMQTLDFWKQQPQIFANLKENTFEKQIITWTTSTVLCWWLGGQFHFNSRRGHRKNLWWQFAFALPSPSCIALSWRRQKLRTFCVQVYRRFVVMFNFKLFPGYL